MKQKDCLEVPHIVCLYVNPLQSWESEELELSRVPILCALHLHQSSISAQR